MLVANVNSCLIIIRQTSFLFLFLVKILIQPCAGFPSAHVFVVQTGIYVRDSFHENKRERMEFLL
jgi:hypothetical protein